MYIFVSIKWAFHFCSPIVCNCQQYNFTFPILSKCLTYLYVDDLQILSRQYTINIFKVQSGNFLQYCDLKLINKMLVYTSKSKCIFYEVRSWRAYSNTAIFSLLDIKINSACMSQLLKNASFEADFQFNSNHELEYMYDKYVIKRLY